MSPSVFTRDQARLIDKALRTAAQTEDRSKAALIRLLAIRVALLAHPMSQVRAGTIHRLESGEYETITESCLYHYVDGLRLTRPEKLWEIAEAINAGVIEGRGSVLKRSILEALPEIRADVAYFDPPYPGVMSYEKEYRVIDQILEGASRPTSPFTAKDGAKVIDGLFERATHIPLWVLSLGNAVVTIEDLVAKMTRLGRETRAIEIKYQHLAAVASAQRKATNREFLVVGWDREAIEGLLASVAGDHAAGIHLGHLAPALVEEDTDAVVAEVPTPPALSQDNLDQGQSDLAEEGGSLGRGITGEDGLGVDDPDAVGRRGRRARHAVGRRRAHGTQ
jgi:hypothetical protein